LGEELSDQAKLFFDTVSVFLGPLAM